MFIIGVTGVDVRRTTMRWEWGRKGLSSGDSAILDSHEPVLMFVVGVTGVA